MNFQSYLSFLKSKEGDTELQHFIDALTTNTTSFFREMRHYDYLDKEGWRSFLDRGAGTERPLEIWSAACSNGSELYTTLISATEFSRRRHARIKLRGIGTDISTKILARARQGLFHGTEITGLSEELRRAYLLRHRTRPDLFRMIPDLRRLCQWQPLNLTEPGGNGPREVDIVFLRNVLIYFDSDTQQRVVSSLARRIRPGGLLFTGHSETLARAPDGFRTVMPSVYAREVQG